MPLLRTRERPTEHDRRLALSRLGALSLEPPTPTGWLPEPDRRETTDADPAADRPAESPSSTADPPARAADEAVLAPPPDHVSDGPWWDAQDGGASPDAPFLTPAAAGRHRASLPRWQSLLAPVSRQARVDPGWRGAAALAAAAVLAVAVTGVVLWRSRPVSQALPPRPTAAPAVTTASPPPGAVRATPLGAEVVVDVAGRVRRPGLVRLPAGARVADAVRACGGPLRAGDVGLLNLAAKVSDGQQIVVGGSGATGGAAAGGSGSGSPLGSSAGSGVVDLNTAAVTDLDGLPGVGPVLAQRIVDWRTAHGRFDRVDQLREVGGIGDRKYAEIKDKVTV